MRPPRRGFLITLGAVAALVALCFAANLRFGGGLGDPCRDSYACRGLLFGGVECVDVDGRAYCTRYCRSHDACPKGWTCQGATPTVFTVETRATDKVCIRP